MAATSSSPPPPTSTASAIVRCPEIVDSNQQRDPLYLHSFVNPILQMVTHPLTLTKILMWNQSIKIALKAKNKLGFIDGSCKSHDDTDSGTYLSWSFVDSMVISWLLHAMTKDLAEAYMYTPSSRELWLELEEKYGAIDKSHIFNIKKQLASMEQGTNSIVAYSNKLKKLMDELHCLEPMPRCICGCSCGAFKTIDDIKLSNCVIQFLMGLNESYSTVVSNILI